MSIKTIENLERNHIRIYVDEETNERDIRCDLLGSTACTIETISNEDKITVSRVLASKLAEILQCYADTGRFSVEPEGTVKIQESTSHNYFKYPGKKVPQEAYVDLQCEDRTLESSYNPERDNKVHLPVHLGHRQRFPISKYLTVESINDLLIELKRPAQIVCEGYSRKMDFAEFTEKAQEALAEIRETCENYTYDEFDVMTWEELLNDLVLEEIFSDCNILEEVEQFYRQRAKHTDSIINDNKELVDYIVDRIKDENFRDLIQIPERFLEDPRISSAICESFEEELVETLTKTIKNLDIPNQTLSVKFIKDYASLQPSPFPAVSEKICHRILIDLLKI